MTLSSSAPAPVRLGTASWAIPAQAKDRFGEGDSILRRYATRFGAVEINSSFYKPHRRQTYARWAASVPPDFRFAVKVPKAITHERRLVGCEALIDAFLDQVRALGETLGPLLIQLPPSLAFEDRRAAAFLARFRDRFEGALVCEPRHASWFAPVATDLLVSMKVARVAADPAPARGAETPGGWSGLTYARLHGSPRIYYSAYPVSILDDLADTLGRDPAPERWCIFDNTALGAATDDALHVADRLRAQLTRPDSSR